MIIKQLRSKQILFLALFVSVSALSLGILLPKAATADTAPVNVWWPTDGAHMSGTQPFKAQVSGLDASQYDMFWQVDGGKLNPMDTNTTDYPHKEASVDVSGWNWKGSGPYTITFVVKQNGAVITQRSIAMYVGGQPVQVSNPTPVEVTSAPSVVSSPAFTPAATDPDPAHALQMQTLINAVVSGKDTDPVHIAAAKAASATPQAPVVTISAPAPIVVQTPVVAMQSGVRLYVDPNSGAAKQAASWQNSNPSDAQKMALLAGQPTAVWFGNWNSNIWNDVHKTVTAAASLGQTPVLVAYDIPQRDCGGFSSGGSNNSDGYKSWIGSFASAIGNNNAIVILEPDALAQISCLSSADQATRLSLLSGAVSTLKANSNTKVYLDAGHSGWVDAGAMASLLNKANVSQADGFSLNVSNFNTTNNEIAYGQTVSSKLYGKHFVVDTSRSGNGSSGEWCNPWSAAIGQKPTLQTGNSLVDAFLWIKTPGESDGTCNGGPSAGSWWPSYALNLVNNAH